MIPELQIRIDAQPQLWSGIGQADQSPIGPNQSPDESPVSGALTRPTNWGGIPSIRGESFTNSNPLFCINLHQGQDPMMFTISPWATGPGNA